MKLVLLIASAMTAVIVAIHILDKRYKHKRIAEIEEKLKGRYKMTFEEAIELLDNVEEAERLEFTDQLEELMKIILK